MTKTQQLRYDADRLKAALKLKREEVVLAEADWVRANRLARAAEYEDLQNSLPHYVAVEKPAS